jgi:glycosyltransferase involved in cell wall biosynthesis
MKLFSIKFGKVWKTIKNEGIFLGGKRVLGYLVLFLKTLLRNPAGDVLFVTSGIGDSARYRAYNQAEELNRHGFDSHVTVLDHPWLPKFADKFKIFVFNRTLVTLKAEKLIAEIKKQNKEIIFDTDDLVFDEKFMHQTESYQKMNALEKKQYEKGVGEEILNDPYVTVCTTTTNFIKNILEKNYNKKVFINSNKINDYELALSEKIIAQKNKNNSQEIKVGYFSGTMSHNKDFATITEALFQIMEKHSKAKLVLVGPLDIENKLNKFEDRIIQSGLVSIKKHYQNIAGVDINLAPLVGDDPFCEAKSELKFFEAGILSIPTVAVRNQTYSEAISDGVDGFLADNTDEWVEKISRLIEDEELRKKMGAHAREKVLRDYTNKNSHSEEYYNFLREILSR